MESSVSFRRPAVPSIAALILAAAAARFLPHLPANFSPIGAMGIFAGAMLPWSWALAVALAGLFVSDLVLGFYEPVTMLFVYAGLALNVLAGYGLCRKKRGVVPVIAAALSGAVLFFIFSNAGFWLTGTLYPGTLSGLITCYVAAVPFFGNTLASQLLFSAALFGLQGWLGRRIRFLHEAS
jgi:hypothetical protein